MRHYIFAGLFTMIGFSSLGQDKEPWIAFHNKDTTLIGFKDSKNTIKIEPKFTGFTIANKFDGIIGVSERVDDKKWLNYYLSKSGRIVGRDSLLIYDNSVDCESEGFIRFRDAKTDKTGMFNRNGDIVIPADYNALTSVRNGMVIGLQGAKKKEWGKESGDYHFSWVGGKEVLIDTRNRVLVDDFNYEGKLNFFSLLVSDKPNEDPVRQNFKTTEGKYYSFIDFGREFDAWLKTSLLKNFTKAYLSEATYKELTFWKEEDGWKTEDKHSFINRNFELIKVKLLELNHPGCKYQVFDDGLNHYIFESEEYQRFFDNCGAAKEWIYPLKNIVISYEKGKDLVQDHFSFLRTEDGYKLISISLGAGTLK